MRILFLTQVLPYPLDAGPKVRAYYVLRHLAQRHDVTLVSFVRAEDTSEALAHLRRVCTAVHTVPMTRSRVADVRFLAASLVQNRPFIIARDWSPAMARLLTELAGSAPFDAVHADQLWMAPYAQLVRDVAPARPLAVLDQHNAVYLIPGRLAADEHNPLKRGLLALEARKLARYEAAVCRRFDRVTWVTQEDFAAVQRLPAPDDRPDAAPLPNDGVIPICADPGATPPVDRRPGARRVTFLGGLHYPPNAQGVRWFAEEIFPQVLAQVPDAVLTVIGKQPPPLDGLGIPAANLDVLGYVADPTPYLAETAAFIVPLLAGGGMRVKIVDGWTWGLPMVSTSVGAEGTAIAPGENILLADTPGEFAAATVRLLIHPDVGRRLCEAGRCTAEQAYGWRNVYRAWDRVYAIEE
ncbi:MAG: glycosyltransferase [Caldilineaceae bacterium]|nr:glycosyltransferase [Caldilineaceae bacterium]